MDETHGTKTNRVRLNIAQVHGAMDAPEPGIAAVFIDGQPIHAMRYIQITAQFGAPTLISMQFECEVTGNLGGRSVEDLIREAKGE
jgi:hypothetical protein